TFGILDGLKQNFFEKSHSNSVILATKGIGIVLPTALGLIRMKFPNNIDQIGFRNEYLFMSTPKKSP
ncbi:hypothetical protein R7J51_22665, partial [Acinetobacter baumannii]|nr:hypothetical protein [Acinetobacter baumannii]